MSSLHADGKQETAEPLLLTATAVCTERVIERERARAMVRERQRDTNGERGTWSHGETLWRSTHSPTYVMFLFYKSSPLTSSIPCLLVLLGSFPCLIRVCGPYQMWLYDISQSRFTLILNDCGWTAYIPISQRM